MFSTEVAVSPKFAFRAVALLSALALPAFAQTAPAPTPSQISTALDTHFTTASGVRIFGMPVEAFRRNQPLSLSLTQTGTLPDGTQHSHTTAERLYRDSSGRLRIESFYNNGQPFIIVLMDPVAGKIFYLHVVGKGGFSPASESSRMMSSLAARVSSANIKPQWPGETTEALPSKTIDGYTADGTRRAWTIPAGIQGGHNDKPVNQAIEEWFSPQLGIDLQLTSDTPTGKATTTASDIQLNEQDPSLFQLPPDYTLIAPQKTQ
jgi:hypothetical protein